MGPYRDGCEMPREGAVVQIEGSTAVVSGGASGLGLATVERLAKAGAHVVILDLPSSNGAAVAERLGERVAFSPGDVTDTESVSAALDRAVDMPSPLRVCVGCAGVGSAAKVVGRAGVFPLDAFQRVVDVNLVGMFNLMRLTAERMVTVKPDGEERGVIVTTASIAASDGQIGQAAYSASKAGIVGMTLPIARELAQHQVRVVSIAPGLFETPLLASLPQDARDSLGQQVPHPRRLGQPEEFAALVEHILNNPMLNGDTIRLDGAVRMAPR
jgi:NAD(P)-dependent dehydrogenase (short-subunit alcohol dehydrogenase family)